MNSFQTSLRNASMKMIPLPSDLRILSMCNHHKWCLCRMCKRHRGVIPVKENLWRSRGFSIQETSLRKPDCSTKQVIPVILRREHITVDSGRLVYGNLMPQEIHRYANHPLLHSCKMFTQLRMRYDPSSSHKIKRSKLIWPLSCTLERPLLTWWYLGISVNYTSSSPMNAAPGTDV